MILGNRAWRRPTLARALKLRHRLSPAGFTEKISRAWARLFRE